MLNFAKVRGAPPSFQQKARIYHQKLSKFTIWN